MFQAQTAKLWSLAFCVGLCQLWITFVFCVVCVFHLNQTFGSFMCIVPEVQVSSYLV